MKLQFNNITKYYGSHCALSQFSTELTEGVYGLLGPNGSGKTTLMNILTTIMKPTQGSILLDGRDVRQKTGEYLQKLGFLPQQITFYKNFRCDEFLGYMCALKGLPKKETKARIYEALEQVNLSDIGKIKVGALSGGMSQRLGIAQAILNNPKILVLDEPTAGLDPAERIRFRNLISKLSKDRLVLLATHIVSDVEYIAKEVLILKKGCLVAKGTPELLCQGLAGKVWDVTIEKESELSPFVDTHIVSNIKRTGQSYTLRVICENQPGEAASILEASLEDVFFSIFRN